MIKKQIANIFNDYFINIGNTLNSNINSTINPMSYMTSLVNTITMPEYHYTDVESAIHLLKNSSA